MDLNTLVQTTIDGHDRNGGSSMSLKDGHSPMSGFMVSLEGHEKRVGGYIDQKDLHEYIGEHGRLRDYKRMNETAEPFLGTWLDSETGTTFLDISVNVDTFEAAKAMGKRNNQLAVYDVAKGETVRL